MNRAVIGEVVNGRCHILGVHYRTQTGHDSLKGATRAMTNEEETVVTMNLPCGLLLRDHLSSCMIHEVIPLSHLRTLANPRGGPVSSIQPANVDLLILTGNDGQCRLTNGDSLNQ